MFDRRSVLLAATAGLCGAAFLPKSAYATCRCFELVIHVSPPASIGEARLALGAPQTSALGPALVESDADAVARSSSGVMAWWRPGRTAPWLTVRLRFATEREAAAAAVAPVFETVAGRRPLPALRYRASIAEIVA